MSDDSEYVSTYDRGAFGQLLAEAKALGVRELAFECNLRDGADDNDRWVCIILDISPDDPGPRGVTGRTGEEALRRLVEKLRG